MFLLKTVVTALVVAGVAELAKRSTSVAAILAALPLTSILTFIWLYSDTGDVTRISDLSYGIFFAVLPSLAFFLIFPHLLKRGLPFSSSLVFSCVGMILLYGVYVFTARKLGIKLI